MLLDILLARLRGWQHSQPMERWRMSGRKKKNKVGRSRWAGGSQAARDPIVREDCALH